MELTASLPRKPSTMIRYLSTLADNNVSTEAEPLLLHLRCRNLLWRSSDWCGLIVVPPADRERVRSTNVCHA